MITIKKICNYKENTKPSQPTANLNYIDFVSEEDELYNRELKRINDMRRLAITYFDMYVEEEVNPTMEGYIAFVAVEEEIENEKISEMMAQTEDSLLRELQR